MPAFVELVDTMPISRLQLAEAFAAQEERWFEDGEAVPVEPPVASTEREECRATPYLIAFAAAVLPLVLSLA